MRYESTVLHLGPEAPLLDEARYKSDDERMRDSHPVLVPPTRNITGKMSPQVDMFVRIIREKLPTHESPQAAAAAARRDFEEFTGGLFSVQNVADLKAALEVVQNTLENVEILHRNSLIKARESWYRGPMPADQHWPALRGFLENAKNWDHESIDSIGDSSSEIVSLLANPSHDQFRDRGLVVGYVQSGKTANMTAVIAKAVDAGYNFIVLLGGITNKLRAQTQRRLLADIVERHRHLWQLYTTVEDNGDFSEPANRQFTMPVQGRAQLAVMKKETSRLKAFLHTIERTPTTILRSLKTLMIDDECDQASVNASSNEYDMTRINEAVRKIIRALPAVSYVGYTATPFANVFINPFPHNKDELDDLYPEDFITDLPRPKDYFGAREVFGFDPDNADDEGGAAAGCDMIRIIPPDQVALIRPRGSKDRTTFSPKVTAELEQALLWFLITCSLRRHRGHASSHMTMLIHTSPYVVQHVRMADAVRAWQEANAASLRAGVGEIWQRLEDVWYAETARVPLEGKGESELTPPDILPWLRDVLGILEIAVENGKSVERLNYTEDAKTYIVVGGSVLARGLTLEGLSVSFFLRTSQQYDTLLQMGRWFGFRHGYADLPRLWATEDLIANFRALARIEEEIREDIAQYRTRKATPLDFAVKVREIPGLAITSAAKMRHAYRTSISFEGKHVQTIRFDHLKDGAVSRNWSAASQLVDDARSKGQFVAERHLFREVPLAVIRRFLMEFNICDRHLDLKQDMLLDYLDKAAAGMGKWNVAIISPAAGTPSIRALGASGHVRTNRRSRLTGTDDYADIKALMSKQDILVDALDNSAKSTDTWSDLKAKRPPVPLLLLYPIEAKSAPRDAGMSQTGRPTRTALNAAGDLIGFGIVFPGSLDRSGGSYSVELDVPTPEQLDDDGDQEADRD